VRLIYTFLSSIFEVRERISAPLLFSDSPIRF
jgi:hypothetical protein